MSIVNNIPEELFMELADAIKEKFPGTFGFFQGQSQGFLITRNIAGHDEQFVLELRPRDDEESFTLFELGE